MRLPCLPMAASFQAGLFQYVLECSLRDLRLRVRNRHPSGLGRVLELMVTAFGCHLVPAIRLKQCDYPPCCALPSPWLTWCVAYTLALAVVYRLLPEQMATDLDWLWCAPRVQRIAPGRSWRPTANRRQTHCYLFAVTVGGNGSTRQDSLPMLVANPTPRQLCDNGTPIKTLVNQLVDLWYRPCNTPSECRTDASEG